MLKPHFYFQSVIELKDIYLICLLFVGHVVVLLVVLDVNVTGDVVSVDDDPVDVDAVSVDVGPVDVNPVDVDVVSVDIVIVQVICVQLHVISYFGSNILN
jgi:hypothetical protein